MKLIFEDKVNSNRAEFLAKVRNVASRLGIDPNWLMAAMYFESGLNPKAVNPYTQATGLIQFMPSTARSLGINQAALLAMNNVAQLEYVYQYLKPYRNRFKSFIDLYLSIFFPLAIGKPDNWVLQTSRLTAKRIAEQNGIFDLNKDNRITVGEIKKAYLNKIPEQYHKLLKPATITVGTVLLTTAIIYGIHIYRTRNKEAA